MWSCSGFPHGPGRVRRWLFFVVPAVIVEFVAWVVVTVPNLSPKGIEAFINQQTWVSVLTFLGPLVLLPVVAGFTRAWSPPPGRDSYCHMVRDGFIFGAIIAGALGVNFFRS